MNQRAVRFEGLFRQFTPLVLFGLVVLVLIEPVMPYGDWLRHNLGDDVVLKGAVVVLLCYVLILWGESLRLHGLLTGVLEAFKAFDRDRASEHAAGAPQGRGAKNPKARFEAARLLIAAMRSDDASIVETSHHNLVRLVGQDLGRDPDVWQRWLSSQES